MEFVLAGGIGVLAAAGVYLVLRPRTFQVIIGLSLLTYAVNLFILAMGRIVVGGAPVIGAAEGRDFADPVPQALVLTSIVISFSMTALFLVILLASRGLTGTDHVDGVESANNAAGADRASSPARGSRWGNAGSAGANRPGGRR